MSIDVADSPSPLESKSICLENKIIIKKRNSQAGEIKATSWSMRKGETRRQVLFKSIILHQIHMWLPSCPNHPRRAHLQCHQCPPPVPSVPPVPPVHTCAWKPHADGRPEEPGAITIPWWFSWQISLREMCMGFIQRWSCLKRFCFILVLAVKKKIQTLIHWGLQSTLS